MNIRKGQEEIAGFVLIVVLVVTIGVVFLILSSKGDDGGRTAESKDIRAFLESMEEYKSECSVGYAGNYRTLGELFKDCYAGKRCFTGESSCIVLNKTISDILAASWDIGGDKAITGYAFNITYRRNSTLESGVESIIFIEKGDCNSSISRGSSNFISAYPGTITDSLKVCYKAELNS